MLSTITTATCRMLIVCALIVPLSCTKPLRIRDDAKEIVAYSLKNANGSLISPADMSVTIENDKVLIIVPNGTVLNGLIPQIEITGVSISPASGVAQDFTNPVIYTVTADDGTTAVYTVTVQPGAPSPLVYMGSSNNTFYALNATTGVVKWQYTGTASFVYSSPTYANGTVYVGSIDNFVYAFDAMTGFVKWKYNLGTTGIESDAVVVDGTVYVGCNDDMLVALDANNGSLKWSFPTGGNISASPKVANGMVYFGSSDGRLYALTAATGQLAWFFQTGAMINQSGPALVDGIIYVGSRDNYLYAINASTGQEKWRFATDGISLEMSSPTVSNGTVYIGGWYDISNFNRRGALYAVNAATGQLVWQKLQDKGIGSSPTVAAGKLFITTDDNNIYALDAVSGNTIWSKEIIANGASASVYDGTVYVGGGGTRFFYALDANTGTEKWKFPIDNGLMTSSPLIVLTTSAYYSGDSGMQD